MTCREKLAIEHPDEVCAEYVGGCAGCPSSWGYLSDPEFCTGTRKSVNEACSECWDREIPEENSRNCASDSVSTATDEKVPSKLIAKITPTVDISKLIDEAMEKKDRYVTVFVNNEGHMSVYVYPHECSDPRWIPVTNTCGEFVSVLHYECSECGHIKHSCSPYCSMCGEKLKLPE